MSGFQRIRDWEVPELRRQLPEALREQLGSPLSTVVVPKNVRAKIQTKHLAALQQLSELGTLLAEWEYAGVSPKDAKRLEVYGRLNSIWYTAAIIRADDQTRANALATFHRIEARKVRSRVSKGYLKGR